MEERNRTTQYGDRIWDEIAPGQAVDPHNIADDGGFANQIIRASWFDKDENIRTTSRKSKLSIRQRLSTFFGLRAKNTEIEKDWRKDPSGSGDRNQYSQYI